MLFLIYRATGKAALLSLTTSWDAYVILRGSNVTTAMTPRTSLIPSTRNMTSLIPQQANNGDVSGRADLHATSLWTNASFSVVWELCNLPVCSSLTLDCRWQQHSLPSCSVHRWFISYQNLWTRELLYPPKRCYFSQGTWRERVHETELLGALNHDGRFITKPRQSQ